MFWVVALAISIIILVPDFQYWKLQFSIVGRAADTYKGFWMELKDAVIAAPVILAIGWLMWQHGLHQEVKQLGKIFAMGLSLFLLAVFLVRVK